ncbi:MAG: glycoside hydrolase family 3 protein [Bacillota bacterium]
MGSLVGCTADGPSGIRMDSGEKATQVPIGTLLAATFNPDLIESLYRFEGKELIQNEIDLLLGPGINIHRHPLNGRNFEYFSEDPYLTGKMAVANVRGIRKEGAHAVAKHFACNSQEQSRNQVDAVVSERALREVYVKGFEMAVKEADLTGIMTAYNPVNGHFSASNYDLNTTILREDWGFCGIVMTDWWAHMNDPVNQGEPSRAYTDHMIRSQNDLYMVVNNDGAETNIAGDNTLKGLQEGTVTRGELQRSAKNICRVLLELPVMTRKQVFRDDNGLIPPLPDIGSPLLTPLPISVSNETPISFTVGEVKTYRIYVTYTSTGEELSQSAIKVTLNETVVATVQANGTNEVELKQKLPKVTLEQGTYTLRFDVQKAGIDVKEIIFVPVD